MYSNKKSLICLFSVCFIFVLAGALFAFSISGAAETEAVGPTASEASATEEALAEDPVSEEAVVEEVAEEPTTDAPSVTEEAKAENKTADPVVGPLTVLNSAGQPATTDDCVWDGEGKVYTIKANDLTFADDGSPKECAIHTEDGVYIDEVTLNNINIYSSDESSLQFFSNGNLTLNIQNHCIIKNTREESLNVSNLTYGNTFLIFGDSLSLLDLNSKYSSLRTWNFETVKISGGIFVNAFSANGDEDVLNVDAQNLIFDTEGAIYVDSKNSETPNAIWSFANNFNLIVNKGYVELHGNPEWEGGAICTDEKNASVVLSEGMFMVGSQSPTAKFEDCKEGVTMEYYEDHHNSLSTIDGKPAGTVIISSFKPTPTPGGGEGSETAQTGDSVPSAAIALLAIIALSGFVVLRTRKSNK